MKRALLGLLLLFPGLTAAGNPVILLEGKVGPYREAANASKKFLPGAVEAEPGANPDLGSASVILAVGANALKKARDAAPQTPVVFCMVLGAGKATLAPLVTGVPLESDPVVALKRLKAIAPAAKRVGVIVNPSANELWYAEAQRAAGAQGVSLLAKTVASGSEVKDAVETLAGNVDALWLPPDPRLFSKEVFSFLLGFSAERKLPLIGFLDIFTQQGALASVSADYTDIGERAGKLAAQILAQAAKTSVPPPVFAPGNLTINLRTANALGINVPQSAVAEAHQVFQ